MERIFRIARQSAVLESTTATVSYSDALPLAQGTTIETDVE